MWSEKIVECGVRRLWSEKNVECEDYGLCATFLILGDIVEAGLNIL